MVGWHYFEDETIDFKEISLLAGDNGSGKSTIIDALQYALVADIRKIRFNSSAASSGQSARSLESYVRCKMGMEGAEYYRGDALSHVVLEFSAPDRVFCAGISVEAFTDGVVKESQWILDDHRLEQVPLATEEYFLPIKEVRERLKAQAALICATKREYNAQLTMRLKVHRRNVRFNPYLEALLRSVSFTPLTSVDQFVCDYILEERTVDISAMKENLDNYREAEEEASLMERKIEALEEIRRGQEEVDTIKRQRESQDFLRYKTMLLLSRREEEINATALEKSRGELEALQRHIVNLDEQRGRYEQLRDELKASLAGNDTQRLLESLEFKRQDLQRRRDEYRRQAERYAAVRRECAGKLGRDLEDDTNAEAQRVSMELDAASTEIAEINTRIKEQLAEIADLQAEEEELEAGNLRYPEAVGTLKERFEAEGIDVWILAELLEIGDPEWRNAVEGVLGERRFDLLVEEQHFHAARDIYTRQNRETSGVGLPRLGHMKEASVAAGSLAEVVETEHPLALRYCAYLLGELMCVDDASLLEYAHAISPDCLYYNGHTFVRISPEVYSRWYIGAEARRRRLEKVREELARVKEEHRRAEEQRNATGKWKRTLNDVLGQLYGVAEYAGADALERQYGEHCAEIERQIAEIDVSEIAELRGRIAAAETELGRLRGERSEVDSRKGKLEADISAREARADELTVRSGEAGEQLEKFLAERRHRVGEFEAYFYERVRGGESASVEELKRVLDNYENARKGLETRLERAGGELLKAKSRFNRDYRLMLDEIAEDSAPYLALLSRYRDTELPSYREKIARARGEAERQFKEHFVARMNEYINDAKESFSEINHTLKEISFGEDRYSFSIRERPEKRQVLDVFRTAMKVEEYRDTLFESLTSDEERSSIESLFREILENDLNSPRVREICDYRTYFTYDIRIRHTGSIDEKSGKPRESSLSKVLREKSGGEAQTPYYVALGASFFRFFKEEEGAIRLALFDEAFNKMDDTRIGTALTFFRRLGMQVVTAVPTEKIETIAPYSDQINLVFRHDHRAYAKEFSQERPLHTAAESASSLEEVPEGS
jgi:uncharacterized protein YPO0396